jgi:hypothetical protein
MMNHQKVEEYFKDLEAILTERNLLDKPKLVWNMDETGKSFEHDPVKVIAEKGARNVPGRTSAMSTDNIAIFSLIPSCIRAKDS